MLIITFSLLNPTVRFLPNGGLRTFALLVGVHVLKLMPQFIKTTLVSFSGMASPLFFLFFPVNHLLHWRRLVKDSVFFPCVVDGTGHNPPIIIRFFDGLVVTPFERFLHVLLGFVLEFIESLLNVGSLLEGFLE